MTEFEQVLQDCLRDLEQGALSLEDCLTRYPRYAAQLEPVLQASVYLSHGREARVTNAFKARVRTRLLQELYAHPRRKARSAFPFLRLATGLALALLVFLAAGTAYAQGALPGQTFYAWKLASENVWRAVSPDPVEADIAISQRRVDELVAVSHDPVLSIDVLKAYIEVTDRLKQEMNAETEARILAILDTQMEALNRSGILPVEPEPVIVQPTVEPTPISTPTPASTFTPLPVVQTPHVNPTDLPQVLPSVEVPTQLVPSVQEPPNVVPTLDIPLLP